MQTLQTQNLLWTQRIRRRQNRYRRWAPYYWTLPRPVESWFEIHYTDRTIPGDYLRRLLWMNRENFNLLLNVIRNRLTRQNTVLWNCLPLEKVLACGLLRLAHGNLYDTIGPVLNRASDISREKKQNFTGFSGANSWKNWPISWDFRRRKVKFQRIFRGKFLEKLADFTGNFWGKLR